MNEFRKFMRSIKSSSRVTCIETFCGEIYRSLFVEVDAWLVILLALFIMFPLIQVTIVYDLCNVIWFS